MTKRKPFKEPIADDDGAVGTLVGRARLMYLRVEKQFSKKLTSEGVNSTLLREFTSVMRAAATLDAEQRKQDGADRDRLAKITAAEVLAWLRTMDATERGAFLREAQQIDSKRSGLA